MTLFYLDIFGYVILNINALRQIIGAPQYDYQREEQEIKLLLVSLLHFFHNVIQPQRAYSVQYVDFSSTYWTESKECDKMR